MTADIYYFKESSKNLSGRIIGEVKGINRVLYDITSKPPATIEWSKIVKNNAKVLSFISNSLEDWKGFKD